MGAQPKLTFPLAKTKKEEIIKGLPEIYLKEINFCEGPTTTRFCGNCPSCKRMKNLLDSVGKYHELFTFGKDDEPVQLELEFEDTQKRDIRY
jgi:7-cyano-7-deazaguanine synthase in queuosine biosynthesis